MIGKKTISCIIPAYNEGPLIAKVLKVASKFEPFDEVIAIDDGSEDDTWEKICSVKAVHGIKHTKNRGKAAAVLSGFEKAKGDLICMLDADLKGLKHQDLEQLIEPHRNQECITLSLRANFFWLCMVTGIDIFSGERVFPRRLLKNLREDHIAKYEIEAYINDKVIKEKLKIISIKWPDTYIVTKLEKVGTKEGKAQNQKMFSAILKKFSLRRIVWQYLYFTISNLVNKLKGTK